jgi:hypothetical protein
MPRDGFAEDAVELGCVDEFAAVDFESGDGAEPGFGGLGAAECPLEAGDADDGRDADE